MNFDPQMVSDYIGGRIKLPPSVRDKRAKVFTIDDTISIATGSTSTLQIVIQKDSCFLVEAISIIAPFEDCTTLTMADIQITDMTYGVPWSNGPVPLRDIAGLGFSPKYIIPILLRPQTTLNVQIKNALPTTGKFYVAMHGRKLYDLTDDEVQLMAKRLFYQYVFTLPALAGGAVSQLASLPLLTESDFMLKSMMGSEIISSVLQATAGTESAEVMGQIIDTKGDRALFAKKIPLRAVVGSMFAQTAFISGLANSTSTGRPFGFHRNLVLAKNTILRGEFDNRASTAQNGLRMTFEGIRMFQ